MNFDHLQQFGSAVVARLNTLIRNVEASSNSFYDSYLDLQESFTKEVLASSGYQLDGSKNSGYLLHGAEVKDFLGRKFGIDPSLIEKLHDHTLKANKHKHQKEKTVTIDSVHAFMEPFYVFSRQCAGLSYVGQFAYDPSFFGGLFGALAKENACLRGKVSDLIREAEAMARENKLTVEELAACKGVLSSLKGDIDDLQEENERIKGAISFIQDITSKRLENLERKYEELDEKVARILNASPKQAPSPMQSPIPNRAVSPEDEAIVKNFFKNAKVYFSDAANGPVNVAEGRMMRRGIACGIAGLITFIVALCLPAGYKAFAIFGALMILYGAFMFLIGFKVAGYEMQDPAEFWIMAKGHAVYNGRTVVAAFSSARWKWITTLLFIVSLLGVIAMLFSASPMVLENPPSVAASFAVLQGVASIVILSICMTTTGRSYEFQYVIFQYGDDVIRFDRKTGQWTARDKRLKGHRL